MSATKPITEKRSRVATPKSPLKREDLKTAIEELLEVSEEWRARLRGKHGTIQQDH